MEKVLNQGTNYSDAKHSFLNNHPRFEDRYLHSSILMQAKQKLYPSFFSTKGLAQDILEVTQAELDIPLNAFICLKHLIEKLIENQSNKTLENSWKNFLGTNSIKGILHSPEYLMGYQKEIQLLSKLPQQKEDVFKRFDDVLSNIDAIDKEVRDMENVNEKETALALFKDVRTFYSDYKKKVLSVCQTINQKKTEGKNIEEKDLSELSRLLEPKATMFGELLPNGPGYRIPRDIARHILSLDNDGAPLRTDPNTSSNHHVSSLPYQDKSPRVFFKADGNPNLKPGKEAMLYNLYRLLNIPVPQTGLLVFSGVDHSSDFYIAQASEAVLGEAPEGSGTNDFTSFCKQVVGAILTNPSDGKPANFIENKEKFGLVSIDNDDVFHHGFSATSDGKGYLMRTKSLLFCFQSMDEPIPKSLSNFLTTLDSQLLLLAWLDELNSKNEEYAYLESVLCFENARQKFQKILPHKEFSHINQLLNDPIEFYSFQSFKDLDLPITIHDELLNSLQTKFSQIDQALSDNFNTPFQELLEKTSPCLGICYKNLRRKFPNPQEALNALFTKNGPSSEASFIPSLIDIDDKINLEMESSDNGKNSNLPCQIFSPLYESLKESRNLDKFLEKHEKRLNKESFQPEEVLREMLCLVRMGLTSFQNAQAIIDFWCKGRKEIKNNINIVEQWDSLFFSLPDPELKWLFSLEKNFLKGWKNCEDEYPNNASEVKGAFMGKRCLTLFMSQVSYMGWI